MSGAAARRFQEWTTSLAADVERTTALLGGTAIAPQGRRFLAGALGYLLTQLDLIPDHQRAGAVDDAMVLRVAYGLAAEHASGVSTEDAAFVGRMSNEEEETRRFLGEELFARLRRFVIEQLDKPVRGRTTEQLVRDAAAREALGRELAPALKKIKPVLVATDEEAEALAREVTSWLKAKLG